jgi:hypothetical protein
VRRKVGQQKQRCGDDTERDKTGPTRMTQNQFPFA